MKRTTMIAVSGALSLLLAACGGSGGSSDGGSDTGSGGGTTEVTVWSWVDGLQEEADAYNKSHPGVQVKVVNAGNDADEYQKVRDAIKAGSGIPDAFFTGAYAVPAFAAQKQVMDLGDLGADKYQDQQVSSSWQGMSFNGSLYSMPAGLGPIMMFYRKDLFDKYHLTVPRTWGEFQQAAEKLKRAAPEVKMTSFPTDYNVFKGLVAQTGQQSFGSEGEDTVSVGLDAAGGQKVAAYWQSLLDDGLVSTNGFLTTEWTQAYTTGKLAALIGGAWLPLVMKPNATDTAGKWAVAPLPQWTAGDCKTGDAGLAGYSIPVGAEHADAAADFVFWLTNSKEAVNMLVEKQSQFPSYLPVLDSKSFLSQKDDFFGGQDVRKEFAKAAKCEVTQANSAVQDYADPQLAEALSKVNSGDLTAPEALTQVQDKIVSFAEDQGYTVKQ